MDLMDIAQRIDAKVRVLDEALKELKKRSEERIDKSAEYDKQLALVLLKLKNGVEMTFEGEKIKSPPVSIMDKVAKGLCYGWKLDMDSADLSYKTILKQIDIIQTQINALQSINKYAKEI